MSKVVQSTVVDRPAPRSGSRRRSRGLRVLLASSMILLLSCGSPVRDEHKAGVGSGNETREGARSEAGDRTADGLATRIFVRTSVLNRSLDTLGEVRSLPSGPLTDARELGSYATNFRRPLEAGRYFAALPLDPYSCAAPILGDRGAERSAWRRLSPNVSFRLVSERHRSSPLLEIVVSAPSEERVITQDDLDELTEAVENVGYGAFADVPVMTLAEYFVFSTLLSDHLDTVSEDVEPEPDLDDLLPAI